ncbi:GNAT family N-acetyltransferase [soil metagenome]
MHDELKIVRLRGTEIQPYITDVARLRIEIFRAFPYLYDGDLAYEEQHLQSYADCADSIWILALDHQEVVGVSTGIPLQNALEDLQKPFIDKNYLVKDIFYFGESVLLSRYRSRGIYRRFYQEREAVARGGKYGLAAFCAVERANPHPDRPHDYIAMDDFWMRLGYQKHAELSATLKWKDLNETDKSDKTLLFWLKNLWQ